MAEVHWKIQKMKKLVSVGFRLVLDWRKKCHWLSTYVWRASSTSSQVYIILKKNTIRDGAGTAHKLLVTLDTLFTLFSLFKLFTLLTLLPPLTVYTAYTHCLDCFWAKRLLLCLFAYDLVINLYRLLSKKGDRQTDWVGDTPIDCYDYKSTCGANKWVHHNIISLWIWWNIPKNRDPHALILLFVLPHNCIRRLARAGLADVRWKF